jgi:hypothetical protein
MVMVVGSRRTIIIMMIDRMLGRSLLPALFVTGFLAVVRGDGGRGTRRQGNPHENHGKPNRPDKLREHELGH